MDPDKNKLDYQQISENSKNLKKNLQNSLVKKNKNSINSETNPNVLLSEFQNSYELFSFYNNFLTEKLSTELLELDNILPHWKNLKRRIYNYTNNHTVSCLIMVYYDLYNIIPGEDFIYTEYDKNIILWAFLIHDISKYINFPECDQNFYDFLM